MSKPGAMFDQQVDQPLPARHRLFRDVWCQAACLYSYLSCQAETWLWRSGRSGLIARAEADYSLAHNGERHPTPGNMERLLRGRNGGGKELNAVLKGTGWVVLNEKGRSCLCRESETAAKLAELEE